MARTSSTWGKFWLWSSIWPWRSRSNIPQNNRDLNQGLLHLWCKFGDPSWKGWWVIAWTSSWLTHGRTHRQTDAGNDNTWRPKLASGKNTLFWELWNIARCFAYFMVNTVSHDIASILILERVLVLVMRQHSRVPSARLWVQLSSGLRLVFVSHIHFTVWGDWFS